MPTPQEEKVPYYKIALILILGLGIIILIPYILGFIVGLTGEGAYLVCAHVVNESEARNGTVVHLTDEDLRQYPALQILETEDSFPTGELRAEGKIKDPQEAREFIERFTRTAEVPDRYVEYRGNYYWIDVTIS
ncbi:hypothetical protein E2N92_02950 [Methanofollis formosanus]|uniref:Uncharacterized protein n=1 Tax=Methanofollis formosanus TaxID=299308 RepID=A0A8G1A129_9EURY|nr:hypothetical protein [Methanofollis formosanus]QYZ78459.1 hypothetical protein E2N92_02950 [Methanofollis formosanus]